MAAIFIIYFHQFRYLSAGSRPVQADLQGKRQLGKDDGTGAGYHVAFVVEEGRHFESCGDKLGLMQVFGNGPFHIAGAGKGGLEGLLDFGGDAHFLCGSGEGQEADKGQREEGLFHNLTILVKDVCMFYGKGTKEVTYIRTIIYQWWPLLNDLTEAAAGAGFRG
jgi:hypothetical protein